MARKVDDPELNRFAPSGAETPGAAPETEVLPQEVGLTPEPEELPGAPVRVYRRSPGTVQSGPAHTSDWIVEFEPRLRPGIEPLMGWTSSADPLQQVRMTFADLESALTYCQRRGLVPDVQKPPVRRHRTRSYADNFLPFPDGEPRPIYQH
ncbi:ETC complex I subunit [Magnetospirillum sp. UT-4]|uniref:ETC complex I subunit n=1 Tax=Magnetospirillum sp. UT-4 TaxID=2681467 RepID=UPI00157464EC|nr:ETC complex I subunit [Magnetospirillum sp. UT-4]